MEYNSVSAMVSEKFQLKKFIGSSSFEKYIIFSLPFFLVLSKFFLELSLIFLFFIFLIKAPLKKNIYIFNKTLFFILFYFMLIY